MRVDAFLMFSWLLSALLILLTACILLGLPAIVYAAPLPDFGFLLALNSSASDLDQGAMVRNWWNPLHFPSESNNNNPNIYDISNDLDNDPSRILRRGILPLPLPASRARPRSEHTIRSVSHASPVIPVVVIAGVSITGMAAVVLFIRKRRRARRARSAGAVELGGLELGLMDPPPTTQLHSRIYPKAKPSVTINVKGKAKEKNLRWKDEEHEPLIDLRVPSSQEERDVTSPLTETSTSSAISSPSTEIKLDLSSHMLLVEAVQTDLDLIDFSSSKSSLADISSPVIQTVTESGTTNVLPDNSPKPDLLYFNDDHASKSLADVPSHSIEESISAVLPDSLSKSDPEADLLSFNGDHASTMWSIPTSLIPSTGTGDEIQELELTELDSDTGVASSKVISSAEIADEELDHEESDSDTVVLILPVETVDEVRESLHIESASDTVVSIPPAETVDEVREPLHAESASDTVVSIPPAETVAEIQALDHVELNNEIVVTEAKIEPNATLAVPPRPTLFLNGEPMILPVSPLSSTFSRALPREDPSKNIVALSMARVDSEDTTSSASTPDYGLVFWRKPEEIRPEIVDDDTASVKTESAVSDADSSEVIQPEILDEDLMADTTLDISIEPESANSQVEAVDSPDNSLQDISFDTTSTSFSSSSLQELPDQDDHAEVVEIYSPILESEVNPFVLKEEHEDDAKHQFDNYHSDGEESKHLEEENNYDDPELPNDLSPASITAVLEVEAETEEYPDPDFLPLLQTSMEKRENENISPLSAVVPTQTPTPPESPHLDATVHSALLESPSMLSLTLSPRSHSQSHSVSGSPASIGNLRPLPLQSRNLNLSGSSEDAGSPVTRPAWSVRASEAPALGLGASSLLPVPKKEKEVNSSTEISSEPSSAVGSISPLVLSKSLPGSFFSEEEIEQPSVELSESLVVSESSSSTAPTTRFRDAGPRARQIRSPLDIALAMQLRPGMGVGADAAFLVRFLMSMFGWLTILVSGEYSN